MLANSYCVSGSAGPIIVERCFSYALTATEDTLTVVIDAATRAGANNAARLTAATNKAPKAGSTIGIASGSIGYDAIGRPTPETTFP